MRPISVEIENLDVVVEQLNAYLTDRAQAYICLVTFQLYSQTNRRTHTTLQAERSIRREGSPTLVLRSGKILGSSYIFDIGEEDVTLELDTFSMRILQGNDSSLYVQFIS